MAIPGVVGASSGTSLGHYPDDENDESSSELKTPLAATEDRNPTLQSRGRDYDGEGESSYGYGLLGNGLSERDGGQMSVMTQDIRQALSKRYESSPNPSRSRANSSTGSLANSSRRSSVATGEDPFSLTALSAAVPTVEDDACGSNGRRTSGSSGDDDELQGADFDPAELEQVRRLGEGTGGAVELVRDARSRRIMAKKASSVKLGVLTY